MPKLAGKVAVITGAGSGMGRATAILFAQEGAKVVVVDIDEAGAKETIEQIRDRGGEAIFQVADVSRGTAVEGFIQHTIVTYGRIDILHNNAGVILVKFVEEMSEEEWDHVLGVNLKAIFFGVKYAVPHMKRQGGGCIINTAS